MKTLLAIVSSIFIPIVPISFAQGNAASPAKSGGKESEIIELERASWEAYKNKQTDAYKNYQGSTYRGVYVDGIKNTDAEVAMMLKSDLRTYSFSDMKVTFPRPEVAVITYRVVIDETVNGKDESGTYNAASVWVKQDGKWLTALYSEVKVTPPGS